MIPVHLLARFIYNTLRQADVHRFHGVTEVTISKSRGSDPTRHLLLVAVK